MEPAAHTLTFFLAGYPPLPNKTISWNWHQRGREAKVWRSAANYAARAAYADSMLGGSMKPVRIDVTFFYRQRRVRDRMNMVASLKPVVDGLVDACIIPDDGPEWLPDTPFVHEMVHKSGPMGIEVTVTEL